MSGTGPHSGTHKNGEMAGRPFRRSRRLWANPAIKVMAAQAEDACGPPSPRSLALSNLHLGLDAAPAPPMLRLLAACVLSVCVLPAFAIHASEAGVVDWYKPLIGDTLTGNPHLSPVFHRVGEVNESTKSYVLSATTSNVLAALHPENGTIGAFGRALCLV